MASKPRSQSRWNNRRMLWIMFQGSNPIAASTTPTRIDSRISRNATASGEPPRKRYRPSWLLAGKSLTSLAIELLLTDSPPHHTTAGSTWGTRLPPSMAARCRQSLERDFQHQALIRLVHDMADRSEFLGGVAAHETVDLQQLLVGEAEIGL